MLADGREALVTSRVEAEPGPLAAVWEEFTRDSRLSNRVNEFASLAQSEDPAKRILGSTVLVNILAIILAAAIVPGIRLDGVLSAVAAGVLLGLVNAVVRPVLLILTLPITLLTLGLFLFVLNGFCFWLVAGVVKGFHVDGFWAAMLGALVVSVASWVVTLLVSDSGKVVLITRRR